jgi:hypothetical protein
MWFFIKSIPQKTIAEGTDWLFLLTRLTLSS